MSLRQFNLNEFKESVIKFIEFRMLYTTIGQYTLSSKCPLLLPIFIA